MVDQSLPALASSAKAPAETGHTDTYINTFKNMACEVADKKRFYPSIRICGTTIGTHRKTHC